MGLVYFTLDYYFFSEFFVPEVMAISWMTVLLQVVAGTIASFLVGMIWFSSYGLGRIWWSYTYPNKKYGECTGLAEGYGIRERGVREREREKERERQGGGEESAST